MESSTDMNQSIRFGPYYVEPVIAGLEKDGTPFIASTDLIGCINFAKDFVVSGTASNMMYGMCESLWEPDLVRLFSDHPNPISNPDRR